MKTVQIGGRPLRARLLHRSPVTLPIPGTLSLDHVKENVSALDHELSDEEFEALSKERR